MAISNGRSLGIFVCLSLYITSSTAQLSCSSNTWITIPYAWATYGSAATVSDSNGCKSLCLNTSSCYGATWNSANNTCQLNLNSSNAISYDNSLTQQTSYYSLIRGYSNCASGGNCTYNWTGAANSHSTNGIQINNISNVNDCIKSCQDNGTCTAVDWNTLQSSCWMYTTANPRTANQNNIYFFRENCIPIATSSSAAASSSTTAASVSVLPTTTLPSNYLSPTPSSSSSSPTAPTTATAATTAAVVTTASASPPSITVTAGSTPVMSESNDVYGYALAIKPAYVVLAGLGGGCLLLVLTALIILCQYPMHGGAETYSTNGTLVHTNRTSTRQEEINMDGAGNVEFNPYYNKSDIDAPDFTKEENLM